MGRFNHIFFLLLFAGLICSPSILAANDLPAGLYARFETSKGVILVKLHYKKTPLTTINFVGLAEGTIETTQGKSKKYYDGLTFHRVEPNFMIQGGDPLANGMGGPGYSFPDEFVDDLRHDSAGVLSMANSGPGTNGSQFFITHKATPWLNDKHTVFGKVIQGQDVVNAISQGDLIRHVTILRIGKEANAFKADQDSFIKEFQALTAKKKAKDQAYYKSFKNLVLIETPGAVQTPSGAMYIQLKQGSGKPPEKGSTVTMHYTAMFMNGRVFGTSKNGQPIQVQAGQGMVVKGWDEALMDMKKGEKRKVFLPYMLAYGDAGFQGVIPPKTDVVFEIEVLDIN